MTKRRWIIAVAMVAALAIAVGLAGCSGKYLEPFKDAPVSSRNEGPAVIGTMPDGFNNWAFKCNGSDGVYTTYHNDAAYGGIAVVPNDKNC